MRTLLSAAEITPTAYAWEIEARELTVRAGRKRVAVDGLDLRLDTGVHGLLGPNGTGKTALIRALATALRPALAGAVPTCPAVTDPGRPDGCRCPSWVPSPSWRVSSPAWASAESCRPR